MVISSHVLIHLTQNIMEDYTKCVIIITSEMPELLAMSDRIMVMFEGKVSGFLDAKEATQEAVVQYAIGG